MVKAYSTSFETDGDMPYGLGCGGTVHLLLERRATAASFLEALRNAFLDRRPLGCAVFLGGPELGKRCVVDGLTRELASTDPLQTLARQAFDLQHSRQQDDGAAWAEYIPARTGIFIFGAGDDAKPLVTQAATLGWHITVADGRSHLATRSRFPEADEVVVLTPEGLAKLHLLTTDAAVLMTHSYDQDTAILKVLLSRSLAYLGVLGPRSRTADLLRDAAANHSSSTGSKVHSPIGLDLGGDSPATIALSILAEIQATLSRRHFRWRETMPGDESAIVETVASLSTVLT